MIIFILNKTHGNLRLLVDDSDYPLIMGKPIHISKTIKGKFYAKISHIDPYDAGKKFLLHRILLGVTDSLIFVDHIDRNGLNNQRYNLRKSSNAQNLMNRGPSIKNKLGVKGVTMRRNRFEVAIEANGKAIYGGSFATLKEASMRYNELANEHHGEFAYQNKVVL
jgi:hypothetical protein